METQAPRKTPLLVLQLNTPGYVVDAENKPYQVFPIEYRRGNFPGGEVFFRIEKPEFVYNQSILVTARLRNSDDVMALMMATDALVRAGAMQLNLKLYYVPYGRQDRVATEGEALSLAVMGKLLQSLPYDRIFILEPHSDATVMALGEKTTVLTSGSEGFSDFVRKHLLVENGGPGLENVVLLSADAGGLKRVERMAHELQLFDVAEGKKHRDLATNKLSGFGVDREDFTGKTCLIADDLCDGGGTFVGLGETLLARGARSVQLMVTQGLFSKGLAPFKGVIDTIYTTNSFRDFADMEPVEGVTLHEYKLPLF